MARRSKPGVFCLEGMWEPDLRKKSSVFPLLQLLHQLDEVNFIHRDVASEEELATYARLWSQKRYSDYRVGYLAFHRRPGSIMLGRRPLPLEWLADAFGPTLAGKVLYFGSCSTLSIPREEIETFRRQTKATAVVGYTRDVDWIESAAFELHLLTALSRYRQVPSALRWLDTTYRSVTSHLGFRAVWSGGGLVRRTRSS
ncbi:MAG: hypothetical protein KDB02_03405 [Acidimicrobiales bacterium]|nr:hypothetical protein [Acidimicrobiales bacterium]